jgi:hypothetical protein
MRPSFVIFSAIRLILGRFIANIATNSRLWISYWQSSGIDHIGAQYRDLK